MDSGSNTRLAYDDYLRGTKEVLDASQNEKEPYKVEVCGREFVVLPGVFSPKYFHDTEIFAKHLPITKGEDVLEIGPGTGAISILTAYQGAHKVIAVDINPEAVRNTRENIELHHMDGRVEVRLGNVYDALLGNEKFDVIFWNTPFGLVKEHEISDIEKSVYDPGYKSTERFIKEARAHLKERGRVLIGFSTTLGRLDLLKEFIEEAGMVVRLVHEESSTEIYPVKFEIFEGKFASIGVGNVLK